MSTRESTEERLRREALQLQVRTSLGRAYAFVHSRSKLEMSIVRSIDDFRLAALEKMGGADSTATIVRVRRNLTDVDRVEEVRQGIHEAVAVIRAHSEIASE